VHRGEKSPFLYSFYTPPPFAHPSRLESVRFYYHYYYVELAISCVTREKNSQFRDYHYLIFCSSAPRLPSPLSSSSFPSSSAQSFFLYKCDHMICIYTHKKRRHSFFFYVHNIKKNHIFLRPELVFRFCYGSSLSHSYLFLPRSVRERNDIFWQKKRPSVRQMFHIHVTPFNAKRKKRFQRCVCVYMYWRRYINKSDFLLFSFFFFSSCV